MADLTTFTRGVTFSKAMEVRDESSGIRILRANNIDLDGNRLRLADVLMVAPAVRVRPDQWLRKNDILVSVASGSRTHVGKVAYIDCDMDFAIGGFMAVVRAGQDLAPRYLYHHLVGRAFARYLDGAIASTTINNLTGEIMGNFEIPVPSIEEQEHIATVLDSYDVLVDDHVSALSGERLARRKQYEHYRDRLLTFQEAA